MKVETPLISWHNREPIFSIDSHISGRIATSGTDKDIKMWNFQSEKITFLSSLNRHVGSVNIVRFSPNGEFLASGSDDNFVLVWQKKIEEEGTITMGNLMDDEDAKENKEHWNVKFTLRGHVSDVYALSWSPNSQMLASGSSDNSIVIWDLSKKEHNVQVIKEHMHYVQGCVWDPLNKFVASQSSDKTAKIFQFNEEKSKKKELFSLKYTIKDRDFEQVEETEGEAKSKHFKMFHDENLNTFFRRPDWTPDGSLLILPAGRHLDSPSSEPVNTVYLFGRNSLNKSVMHLPGHSKASIAVRACPIYFKQNAPISRFGLNYRMLFAVLTLDSVVVYDTERDIPLSYTHGIHYAELTDLTWTTDGSHILVSSKDGFVSILSFDKEELGEPLPKEEWPKVSNEST